MTYEEATRFAECLKNNWPINFNDMEDFCDIATECINKQIYKKSSYVDKDIRELYSLVADVNPNEIAEHIKHGSLSDWCANWRIMAKIRLAEMVAK